MWPFYLFFLSFFFLLILYWGWKCKRKPVVIFHVIKQIFDPSPIPPPPVMVIECNMHWSDGKHWVWWLWEGGGKKYRKEIYIFIYFIHIYIYAPTDQVWFSFSLPNWRWSLLFEQNGKVQTGCKCLYVALLGSDGQRHKGFIAFNQAAQRKKEMKKKSSLLAPLTKKSKNIFGKKKNPNPAGLFPSLPCVVFPEKSTVKLFFIP